MPNMLLVITLIGIRFGSEAGHGVLCKTIC